MDELEIARQCAAAMLEKDKASNGLGIVVEIPKPGKAVATMTIRDDMVNGFDVIHGGLTFTLADTAFACACNAYDQQTVAASAHIEFLRPGMLGDVLTAVASEDYRGRRNGDYTIEVRNQSDEMVALFRGRSASNGNPVIST